MTILGISRSEVASAAGLSEGIVSRQLSEGARLSQSVRKAAHRLIRERALELGREVLAHYGLDADPGQDAEE
jgi:hypothetical protein